MNEDELRAFLESATGGEHESEGDAHEGDAKDPEAPRMSFEELMGIKREGPAGGQAGAAPGAPAAAHAESNAAGSGPGDANSKPDAAKPEPEVAEPVREDPAEPVRGGDNPELTPIVLPGPPRTTKKATATEPFWDSRRPAAGAQPSPADPTELPATAPLPVGAPEIDDAGDPVAQLFASDPLPSPETEDYEKIAVVGSEKTRSRFAPWVIVGAGAVLAIVASLVVVFAVRGGEEAPPTAEPTTQSPAEPTTAEPTEETPVEPTESEPPADEAPEVDVGNTGNFKIDSWGMQGEISAKFGWPSYKIVGDDLIFEGGTLLPQFPDSCAAMRTGFGITKKADGAFEVYRPAETCAEAPDFYNEVWGLTAAIIPTLKAA